MSGDNKKQEQDDMDLLVAAMSHTVEVAEYTVPLEHPRYAQFKNYGAEVQHQKKRRSDWLERQKEGRVARFDKRRSNFESNDEATSSTNDAEMNDNTSGFERQRTMSGNLSSADTSKPGSWKRAMNQGSRKIRSDLKGRLMYSEWLIDVPEDFAEKWVMIPAPKAKRVMITIEKNFCQVFNKAGESLNAFTLASRTSSPIILDGFINKGQIYILDFIQCGPFDLESCDFACRRMMGKSFLEEHEILKPNSDKFEFEFLEPTADCKKETIEKFMSEETPFVLDGLMFYYNDSPYYSGITPLVTWLKPWMLPDILNVPVNDVYLKDVKGSAKEFMEEFAKNHPTYGQTEMRNKMDLS